MEEVLYTFAPDNGPTAQTAWAAVGIALGALAGMGAMLKKKAEGRQRNQNLLAAMLLFFVALIGSGTAFFSWLKIHKTGPVVVYQDAIETPFGKAAFSNIKDAYVQASQQPSLIDPGRSVRTTELLVVEEKNGKAHVMSEEDYPIKDILPALRRAVKEWEKERRE